MAPYSKDGNLNDLPIPMYFCYFGIIIVVTVAIPYCVLPIKDSIEQASGVPFTRKINFIVTGLTVLSACAISLVVEDPPTIMTILGATTNSAIGFLLPITFYLSLEKDSPKFTLTKVAAYCLFAFICICSVVELVVFGIRKWSNKFQ